MPRVTVLYFAQLRELRGADDESLVTAAATTGALWQELSTRHRLTFPTANVAVAVNENVVGWGAPLAEGDTVVFLPPVSGG